MSTIFYGVFEILFLLSSCYLLNKSTCTSPLVKLPTIDVNDYYIITKDEYERYNKQSLLLGVAPPEYKAIADESCIAESPHSIATEPTINI